MFRYATAFNQDIFSEDEADNHKTKDEDDMAHINEDTTKTYFVDDNLSTLIQLNMLWY
jgi:hypothetical protein